MPIGIKRGQVTLQVGLLVTTAIFGAALPNHDAVAQSAPGVIVSGNDGGFFSRLYQAYADEFYKMPPEDPNAPCSHRPCKGDPNPFPPAPVTAPPYPFTEWPVGASVGIGSAIPNAVDSPLMKALAPTDVGKAMEAAHIQMYGWIDTGANLSTSRATGHGNYGNSPTAYAYRADTIQMNQAVLYVERVPDTVQRDHIDWGFRVSGIYGTDYRYTTGYGYSSGQLLNSNQQYGYDYPMMYGELYVPWIGIGTTIRAGRYISIPDIEAQLAPNNYMYSHSLTYAYDNYTNTGIAFTTQLSKNYMIQYAISCGTDSACWDGNKDRGVQPTFSASFKWTSDNNYDSLYVTANGLNSGAWGYNNLQWYGFTYYHKFDEKWHISFEAYTEGQRNVPNANNPYYAMGYRLDDPYTHSFAQMINPPNLAQCSANKQVCGYAYSIGTVAYLNYRVNQFNNLSFRAEYYDDANGQRTGVKTRIVDYGIGLQHWMGPQIELRPEVTYYHSQQPSFGNNYPQNVIQAGTGPGGTNYGQKDLTVVSSDLIFHF